MKAGDIMSSRVISVGAEAPVTTAIQLMLLNHISGLPVIDEAGKLVGIVSEGDFLRRPETGTERRRPDWLEFLLSPGRLANEYVRSHARKVADVMTPDVITVPPDTAVAEVVNLMERHRIKRVPVVEKGRVVGMVTRRSLLQSLATFVVGAKTPVLDDGTLRSRILTEIHKLPWTPRASLNVIVQNSAVHLWGVILDERQRKAMCLAAESIPGVKEVHDHLVWVEPISGMSIESPEDAAAPKPAPANAR